ncbi:hypothetical protein EDD22DRAFT_1008313 [Suillus occidentalis]|nr:hypothetical protein EDD22DRAFT_1008313 [Suillus occidentalis]
MFPHGIMKLPSKVTGSVSAILHPMSLLRPIPSHANSEPTYTKEELLHQILLLSALRIPSDRVVTFGESTQPTVESIIQLGLRNDPAFVERRLKKGEGKPSGTTGKPKAVAIAHYAPIVNVIQMAQYTQVNENYAPWEERGLEQAISSLERFPSSVRLFIAVLYGVKGMLSTDIYGLVLSLMKVNPNAQIGQGYGGSATSYFLDADVHRTWNPGLTETSTSLTTHSVNQKIGVPASAGRLLPGVVARVVKPDGSLAGFNEPGELRVKTHSLALGNWNDEQATKENFVKGWLRTGDEVIIREDKEVLILDRLKENIENHRDVAYACVVPISDDYGGEVPLAFVVLRAAQAAGLPSECVITFDESNQVSVDSLIQQGLRSELNFIERNGRTKAVAISHFASIVNVIQMAEHQKVNKNYAPWEEQRFRPGDVVARVLPFFHIYGMVLGIHFITFFGLSVVVIPKFNFTEFLERPL